MSNLKFSDLEVGDIFYMSEYGSSEIFEKLENFDWARILHSEVGDEGSYHVMPFADVVLIKKYGTDAYGQPLKINNGGEK